MKTSSYDGSYNSVDVVQHIFCRDAQRCEAMFSNHRIASRVAGRLVAATMNLTVNLDGKPRGKAGKIQAIMVERVLFAKT